MVKCMCSHLGLCKCASIFGRYLLTVHDQSGTPESYYEVAQHHPHQRASCQNATDVSA